MISYLMHNKLNFQPILPSEKCPSAVDTVHWLEIESTVYHNDLQGDFEYPAHKLGILTLSSAPAQCLNPTQPLNWTHYSLEALEQWFVCHFSQWLRSEYLLFCLCKKAEFSIPIAEEIGLVAETQVWYTCKLKVH